jgi:hypothetical protein
VNAVIDRAGVRQAAMQNVEGFILALRGLRCASRLAAVNRCEPCRFGGKLRT